MDYVAKRSIVQQFPHPGGTMSISKELLNRPKLAIFPQTKIVLTLLNAAYFWPNNIPQEHNIGLGSIYTVCFQTLV